MRPHAPRRWEAVPVNEYGSAYWQCQRKRAYCSAAQARVAIKRAKRAGVKQATYRCRICGLWHVATIRA